MGASIGVITDMKLGVSFHRRGEKHRAFMGRAIGQSNWIEGLGIGKRAGHHLSFALISGDFKTKDLDHRYLHRCDQSKAMALTGKPRTAGLHYAQQ